MREPSDKVFNPRRNWTRVEVEARCWYLGCHISKSGFAQYLADGLNKTTAMDYLTRNDIFKMHEQWREAAKG